MSATKVETPETIPAKHQQGCQLQEGCQIEQGCLVQNREVSSRRRVAERHVTTETQAAAWAPETIGKPAIA
jgi:hypothetical protein